MKNGFSLIELAIVLAIIGLLAGGIVSGQSLMEGFKRTKVVTDAKLYFTSADQFRQKYGSLPGDFPTATQIWGRADNGTPITSNCAAPATDVANTEGTCNGNGNGVVGELSSYYEELRYWQQLRLAGYIEGNYAGGSSAASNNKFNRPAGSYDESYYNSYSSWGSADPTDQRGAQFYGLTKCTASFCGSPSMTGENTFLLDQKFDDGLPARGMVQIHGLYSGATCKTGTWPNLAYVPTGKTPDCIVTLSSWLAGPGPQ